MQTWAAQQLARQHEAEVRRSGPAARRRARQGPRRRPVEHLSVWVGRGLLSLGCRMVRPALVGAAHAGG